MLSLGVLWCFGRIFPPLPPCPVRGPCASPPPAAVRPPVFGPAQAQQWEFGVGEATLVGTRNLVTFWNPFGVRLWKRSSSSKRQQRSSACFSWQNVSVYAGQEPSPNNDVKKASKFRTVMPAFAVVHTWNAAKLLASPMLSQLPHVLIEWFFAEEALWGRYFDLVAMSLDRRIASSWVLNCMKTADTRNEVFHYREPTHKMPASTANATDGRNCLLSMLRVQSSHSIL